MRFVHASTALTFPLHLRMKKLLTPLFALLLLATAAPAQECTFTATSGNWNDAGNWSCTGGATAPPNSAFNGTITIPTGRTVNLPNGSTTDLGTVILNVSGTVNLGQGATLSMASGSIINIYNGGSLEAPGGANNPRLIIGGTQFRKNNTDATTLPISGPTTVDENGDTGTLPVTWAYFTAEAHNGAVMLKWATSYEHNNAGFTIQKGASSLFDNIGTLPAVGESQSISYYSFIDEQPAPGRTYYRIQQTDYDGTTSFSPVIEWQGSAQTTEVSVYPNPVAASGQISVRFSSPIRDQAQVLLVSAQGGVLRSASIAVEAGSTTITTLTTEGLAPGLYLVQVNLGGMPYSRKVVVAG